METKAKAMVMASCVADALALGAHWIYDTERIAREYGRVDTLLPPAPDSFHATKGRGEFTHYGDQMMVLLESTAACGGFDLEDFARRWRALFAGYRGYLDGATRDTLHNFARGKAPGQAGSASDDLAGAARIAPVVCCLRRDPTALVAAVRSQTRLTHTDPATVAAAECFARAAVQVLEGRKPTEALEAVARDHLATTPIPGWIRSGLASLGEDTLAAINRFGQSCHTREAFPGVVHLVAKYEENCAEALIQCVGAGGDSAARGMAAGMLLGAYLGEDFVPRRWLEQMRQTPYVETLVAKIL